MTAAAQRRQDVPHFAFSIPEAAAAIGVGKSTVWELVAKRELITFKLGARTLIRAEEIKALIDRKAAEAKGNQPSPA